RTPAIAAARGVRSTLFIRPSPSPGLFEVAIVLMTDRLRTRDQVPRDEHGACEHRGRCHEGCPPSPVRMSDDMGGRGGCPPAPFLSGSFCARVTSMDFSEVRSSC